VSRLRRFWRRSAPLTGCAPVAQKGKNNEPHERTLDFRAA
jgi:hypothetical protein